ncbi:MAG: dockerin type I repeat-containing protein, partial [candidate division Zixibacteria bacterium]|nr:dockerin type I repeat-containing protein [candidate division Zixibacteria bacterium]
SRIQPAGPPEVWLVGDFQRPFWFTLQDCCINPGDANNDTKTNIADVVFLISWLFTGGASPACCAEGSANGDGKINIADVTYIISWLFSAGPFPVCGPSTFGC